MELRPAGPDDLAAIVAIYNHYVAHSIATFDESPVTVEDRRSWFDAFGPPGPHRLLVADDGEVAGYACSGQYRAHPSFDRTVELSAYRAPDRTGQGLGSRLYERLLAELPPEVHRVVAGIALPNEASVQLHRRFGFEEVGTFDEYAAKDGRYISSMWMQLRLPRS